MTRGTGAVLVVSGRGLREQLWDADQVVSCDRKGEHRRGLGKSSNLDLVEPGLCLDPAEHLLDPLAQDLADPITRMPGGAAIDCGLAHHAMLADRAVDGTCGVTARSRRSSTKAVAS